MSNDNDDDDDKVKEIVIGIVDHRGNSNGSFDPIPESLDGDSPADGFLNLGAHADNVITVDFRPKPPPIMLTDNIDVAFVLWAVNMFGIQQDDPEEIDPMMIISLEDVYTFKSGFTKECLKIAIKSDLLSKQGKEIILKILANST